MASGSSPCPRSPRGLRGGLRRDRSSKKRRTRTARCRAVSPPGRARRRTRSDDPVRLDLRARPARRSLPGRRPATTSRRRLRQRGDGVAVQDRPHVGVGILAREPRPALRELDAGHPGAGPRRGGRRRRRGRPRAAGRAGGPGRTRRSPGRSRHTAGHHRATSSRSPSREANAPSPSRGWHARGSGSEPAVLVGDPGGVGTVAAAGLADRRREVVADGALAQMDQPWRCRRSATAPGAPGARRPPERSAATHRRRASPLPGLGSTTRIPAWTRRTASASDRAGVSLTTKPSAPAWSARRR